VSPAAVALPPSTTTTNSGMKIVTAKLDGSDEVNLTQDPAYDVYPIWSHDGRWIYFSSVRPAFERRMHLWRIPAEGGSPETESAENAEGKDTPEADKTA